MASAINPAASRNVRAKDPLKPEDLGGSSVIRCADMKLRPDVFGAVAFGAVDGDAAAIRPPPSMNRGHGRIFPVPKSSPKSSEASRREIAQPLGLCSRKTIVNQPNTGPIRPD
jgi:hypothetical protein